MNTPKPLYTVQLLCPVCDAVMDTINVYSEQASGLTTAMLGGDGRKIHKQASPTCAKDSRWIEGWKEQRVET